MQVLIIGGGGREHAMAWKVAQSPQVDAVWVAPGNAGTANEAKVTNVAIEAENVAALLEFALNNRIDLTIVGPEQPLSLGVVDKFHHAGLRCFGPSQRAARLESSKAYCKDFLHQHQIPTARYATFTEIAAAVEYCEQHPLPLVIKADGLAAGKGVIIALTLDQAKKAIYSMLQESSFGEAGQQIVIEEFLSGEELSYIVITDGTHVLPFASSQDHKRRDAGDQGPNTGGMGAYSPAPVLNTALEENILTTIIQPTLAAMKAQGDPYLGFLYAGLMIDAQGNAKVLEFNCRLGDPETQPLLMRLQSDLAGLCMATLEGQLNQVSADWDPRPALGVVMASGGYPEASSKGHTITGLDQELPEDCKIFHAGTQLEQNQVVTNGGRVLCITALGDTLSKAQHTVYRVADTVHWPERFFRHDIGHRAIKAPG